VKTPDLTAYRALPDLNTWAWDEASDDPFFELSLADKAEKSK
jgi:hypothetical protein